MQPELAAQLAKSADRAIRGRLGSTLIARHRITAIAAEAASFNTAGSTWRSGCACRSVRWPGRRGTGPGALRAAQALAGRHLRRPAGDRRAIDYAEVERSLVVFLGDAGGTVQRQLAAIPAVRRNHARDAVSVGVFAAMTPEGGRGSGEERRCGWDRLSAAGAARRGGGAPRSTVARCALRRRLLAAASGAAGPCAS